MDNPATDMTNMTPELFAATLNALVETNRRQAAQNEALLRGQEEMSQTIRQLQSQLAWFQNRYFGKSSEKHAPFADQPGLFEEFNAPADMDEGDAPCSGAPDPSKDRRDTDGDRKKRESRLRAMMDRLPVLKREVIEPEGGVDLSRYRRIGEEVTRTLECEPGKLYVKETVRPKYGLIDPTEPAGKGEGVLIAPMPLMPIYKGIPGASMLTEILLDKFEYHMPYYRQIKKLFHQGLEGLTESTVDGWFKKTAELLRPLYSTLEREVFSCDYVQADETVVPVVDGSSHKAEREYLWQARAVMDRLVIFFYDEGSRAGDVIKEKTDRYGFKGYLQCDGFGGYTAAFRGSPDVTLVFCMTHMRRDFRDAVKENRKPAEHAMAEIQKLYRIEDECDDARMDFGQRAAYRREHARPILDSMKKWMEEECLGFSPRTLIGQAVTYAYTRWDAMYAYLDDGRIMLDNNLSENEVRPITLGRKNWMFCGNHEAVRNMCVIASLLATCRNHSVNPRDYLNHVISAMPYKTGATHGELLDMLPHRWKLAHPESVMPDFRATQRKTKKK